MFFILLLILSTIAIAGSAAFFSVYGLAHTFGGVFWSMVVMGASLEAGKLVAASYLYRYWTRTNVLLRSYMMAGVLVLMLLTSGGIFGYLSSGYQADVLPLKQIDTQITLLEEEKARVLARKKEMDQQVTQMPENYATARIKLMREQEPEQKYIQQRIKELDKEVLELKQTQIKTEAHIGPITYVAKAFDLGTDDATKWLIFMIIFAFDPMAVALTLAVNIALRRREEEKAQLMAAQSEHVARKTTRQPRQRSETPRFEPAVDYDEDEVVGPFENADDLIDDLRNDEPVETIEAEFAPTEQKTVEPEPVEEPVQAKPEPVQEPITKPEQLKNAPTPVLLSTLQRHIRAYPELWKTWVEGTSADEKIEQLLTHFKHLKEKQRQGKPLTKDEVWVLGAITEILKRKGLNVYFDQQ